MATTLSQLASKSNLTKQSVCILTGFYIFHLLVIILTEKTNEQIERERSIFVVRIEYIRNTKATISFPGYVGETGVLGSHVDSIHWQKDPNERWKCPRRGDERKRFSFGGAARAAARPRRRGPRLAEAERTRTNSRLESHCRDASVRTRARAGCLACLPSASFEVRPLSFLRYRESRRRGGVFGFSKIRALPRPVTDTGVVSPRSRLTFPTSPVSPQTFSPSPTEWLDELVARVTLEYDRRRARTSLSIDRHAVSNIVRDRFSPCLITLRTLCNVSTRTSCCVRVIVLYVIGG